MADEESDDEFEQYWDYPNRKAMERAGMKNSDFE
jgi:hypothetical protein